MLAGVVLFLVLAGWFRKFVVVLVRLIGLDSIRLDSIGLDSIRFDSIDRSEGYTDLCDGDALVVALVLVVRVIPTSVMVMLWWWLLLLF